MDRLDSHDDKLLAQPDFYQAVYNSPIGKILLVSTTDALCGLWFEGQKYFGAGLAGFAPVAAKPAVLIEALGWLDDYFAGRPSSCNFALAPAGTVFQQLVWRILLEVPFGQTISYGELAHRLAQSYDRPLPSARAIGGAVGHNPIALIIPCHRVVGASGELTGYAGGIERKHWLLEHEQREDNQLE